MTTVDTTVDNKYIKYLKEQMEDFSDKMEEPTLEELQERLKKVKATLRWMTYPPKGQRKAYYGETIPARRLIKRTKKDIRDLKFKKLFGKKEK